MFANYFKIAFRNLTKNPIYSFINITGLTVGIASSILIFLWVADEVSFNGFHKNYDRLSRVYLNQEYTGGISTASSVPYALKEGIRSKSSQVKHIVMTNWGEGNLLAVGENKVSKVGLSVSEDFLKMFSFDLIKGSPETALTDPYSIVLTESVAKILFSDSDPINQTVKIDNAQELKVTGVIKDVPQQSTFQFSYLLPFAYYESTMPWVQRSKDSWQNYSFQMYVELQEGSQLTDVNQTIEMLIRDNDVDAPTSSVFLHPMKDWRLYSDFENGQVSGGMIEYVQLFTVIAIFLLVIGCINFMNLATARSESRAREVGIRKSVGSRRKELIFQFLGESILVTSIAFLMALLLVELALPFYNTLVSKELFIDFKNISFWIGALSLVLITGFVAGSYPAFYLSAFQPVKVLKGKVQVGKGASTPRKILVTLQFGFSILLIVGTVVVYQQVQHIKAREVGYDRENLMLLWTNNELEGNFKTIKEELLRSGSVKSVTKSNSPVTKVFSTNTVEWKGMPDGPPVNFTTIATEYDYTSTLGIKLLQGRDFSPDFKSDSSAIVINKAAMDLMGMKTILGEHVKMWDADWSVIGVMDNVVMGAPDQHVDPLVMIFGPGWSSTIAIRLEKTEDLPTAVSTVESVFKKYNPTYPFAYRFADTEFNTKFAAINLISRLTTIFASLAILITCLGLFGLAAFTAEQRTKEIGIRKVMGATSASIVLLITKDFSRLVLVAFIISAPIAYYFLNTILEQYPYRISIQWWLLPAVGLFALVLALTIVSTQALRAAGSNPSKSLRSE
ncbi:ABC transporter permease [soil metagenome]